MRIDLCGPDALVAKQYLYHSQVSTPFEQGCGKRVSQGVWRDGLRDASLLSLPINNLNNQILFGMMTSKDTNTSAIDFKRKDAQKPTATKPEAIRDSIKPSKPAETAKPVTIKPATREGYCIVLASYVTKHNAENFISKLEERGYKGAEIYVHKNVTRIVYGHYENQADAYAQLHKIAKEKDLAESWAL